MGWDVDELADTALGGQVTHHAGQERPVRPRSRDHLRAAGHDFVSGQPVGQVVVFAAEPVAIYPGRMGYPGIELGR